MVAEITPRHEDLDHTYEAYSDAISEKMRGLYKDVGKAIRAATTHLDPSQPVPIALPNTFEHSYAVPSTDEEVWLSFQNGGKIIFSSFRVIGDANREFSQITVNNSDGNPQWDRPQLIRHSIKGGKEVASQWEPFAYKNGDWRHAGSVSDKGRKVREEDARYPYFQDFLEGAMDDVIYDIKTGFLGLTTRT